MGTETIHIVHIVLKYLLLTVKKFNPLMGTEIGLYYVIIERSGSPC